MKWNITVQTSGVDLGDYDGATVDEAIEAMAKAQGYDSFRDMCSITSPDDLDAEIERERRDLIVTVAAE